MEIANNIISVLEFIFQKLGIAFDWTVDTVTPYLQEALVRFVSWKSSEYQFWIIFGAILLGVGIIGCILVAIVTCKLRWDENTFAWLLLFIPMIIAGMIMMPVNIWNLIRVENFPELAFGEWIAELVKSIK